MAEVRDRWPDNAPGPFYVDRECIVCTVCSEIAPDHFRLSETEDHDVCYRQPATRAERERCEAAEAECPVEAIGSDGAA